MTSSAVRIMSASSRNSEQGPLASTGARGHLASRAALARLMGLPHSEQSSIRARNQKWQPSIAVRSDSGTTPIISSDADTRTTHGEDTNRFPRGERKFLGNVRFHDLRLLQCRDRPCLFFRDQLMRVP